MRRVLALGLCAGLAGAYAYLDAPPPKWGGGAPGTSSGGTVTFYMNEAGTPDADDEDDVIAAQLAEWEAATGGSLDLAFGGAAPFGPTIGDGLNVVGWSSLGPGVGAVASPMYFGDTIEEADIEMNSDMDWGDPVMLENVLLHELGHCVGMDHEDDVPAVMTSFVTGTTDLTGDDAAGIAALYGGGSGGGGTGGGGSGGGSSGGGGGSGGGSSSDEGGGDSGSSGDDDGGGGSSCGLLGLEMPVLFLGLILLRGAVRRL
jgi:hypothetical protein